MTYLVDYIMLLAKSHAITSGYFNSHERLIIICANSIKNILLINSNPENRDQRISWNLFYFLERNECKSDNAFKTSKPLSCFFQEDAPHEKKPKKDGEKSGWPLHVTPSPLIPFFSDQKKNIDSNKFEEDFSWWKLV